MGRQNIVRDATRRYKTFTSPLVPPDLGGAGAGGEASCSSVHLGVYDGGAVTRQLLAALCDGPRLVRHDRGRVSTGTPPLTNVGKSTFRVLKLNQANLIFGSNSGASSS